MVTFFFTMLPSVKFVLFLFSMKNAKIVQLLRCAGKGLCIN